MIRAGTALQYWVGWYESMDTEDGLKILAHHVHVLLGEYIQIHNSLFKFSLRHCSGIR